jgi:glycosyltransferase 2 family protein
LIYKKIINPLKYIFGFVIFIYIGSKINYETFDFSIINYTLLIYSIIPLFIFVLLQGFRFNFLLIRPLKKIELLFLQLKFHFFNQIFPAGLGGDIYRILLLKKGTDSLKRLSAISIIDRLSGLLIILLMSIWSLNFLFIEVFSKDTIIVTLLAALGLGFIFFVVMLSRFWYGYPLIKKILMLIVYSCGCWVTQITRLWLLSLAIGLNFSLPELTFILGILYFASLAPFTIGGLGVVEGAFVFALTTLGVTMPLAAFGAILMRITSMISAVPGFWLWLRDK